MGKYLLGIFSTLTVVLKFHFDLFASEVRLIVAVLTYAYTLTHSAAYSWVFIFDKGKAVLRVAISLCHEIVDSATLLEETGELVFEVFSFSLGDEE